MIDWIKSLFCDHQWRIVEHGELYEEYFHNQTQKRSGARRRIGNYENHVCNKCLKKKQLQWKI